MRMRIASSAAAVLLALAAPARAQETPGERLPVVKHVLRNGMTFLFLRRSGAPTVSFVTHFRAGGVDEWTGISGTAHLFEHMLFKGTHTLGTTDDAAEQAMFPRIDAAADSFTAEFRKGALADSAALKRLRDRLKQLEDSARRYVVSNELWRVLTENGAQNLNASTGNDLTNYFFQLPANRAKLWFVLESDRIRHPVLREFYSEREVVMEERRLRVENQPGGRLREEFFQAAFRAHPYQGLVIRDRIGTTIFSFEARGELSPRLFTFSAVPIAPHTTQEIEAAVYDELDRLRREPPSAAELERVRNQVQAGAIERLQDNFGLAFQLSQSEALWYDW